MLQVQNLSYTTPAGKPLLSDLTFELRAGDLCLVTGPNGCGKSTLLRVLMGKGHITSGEINHGAEGATAKSDLGCIPQIENTAFHLPLTLEDVIQISSRPRYRLSEMLSFKLLEENHLTLAWNTASGGERKRALLTRTLLKNPKVLLLDEPMNHLDDLSRRTVVQSLARFLSESVSSHAAILVSHEGLLEEERALFNILELRFSGGRYETRRYDRIS